MSKELLNEGDKAPDLKGVDQDGKEVSLGDFKGKKLVLFFYPKDMTPGCTKEACDLRDNYDKLREHGFEVLGVSADDESRHKKFIDKYDLPFRLLADTGKDVIKSYGVWGKKKMYGKEFDGIFRTTYIINEDGKIDKVFKKVKTSEHTDQILDAYGLN